MSCLVTKKSTARKKAEKTVSEIKHSRLVHKRLQSMMEKEPQISRHNQTSLSLMESSCENIKYTQKAERIKDSRISQKIQISILLISNNKTIPFNYCLLVSYCVTEGLKYERKFFICFRFFKFTILIITEFTD